MLISLGSSHFSVALVLTEEGLFEGLLEAVLAHRKAHFVVFGELIGGTRQAHFEAGGSAVTDHHADCCLLNRIGDAFLHFTLDSIKTRDA